MTAIPQGKWLGFDTVTMEPGQRYKFLLGGVVPRPIAWISTLNAAGAPNLAPFSFFNAVASNPMSLMVSITRRPDGTDKDTLANILATKEFVVNSVNEWMAGPMNHTSAPYPPGVNEFQKAGLEAEPSVRVKPARVKGAALQFECELYDTLQVGDGSVGSSHIVVGRVVYVHVLDQVYRSGHIDLEALKPLSRLAGMSYGKVSGVFDLERPKEV